MDCKSLAGKLGGARLVIDAEAALMMRYIDSHELRRARVDSILLARITSNSNRKT